MLLVESFSHERHWKLHLRQIVDNFGAFFAEKYYKDLVGIC